ncbi:DUF1700 domain-containing protein [Mycoplasmatota bacterium]|nr:DUF1700 domain-containing protein [Mycoplasmatota bacterium]
MNKREFMKVFNEQLKGIPEQDKKDILYDYEEHFTIGMNEGREEEDIAKSLGHPKSLAKEMRANYMITRVEESFTVGNFFRALFASLGLGFFNLVFILGPFIAVAATIFALFVSGVAFIVSGLFVIIAPFFPNFFDNVPSPILGIFVGLAISSLGGLWTIGTVYLSKWFYIITIKYFKFNLSIIMNRRK